MRTAWQLQTAKPQFSKVVELCAEEGPQTITKHGRPVAHLISHDDYELWQRPGHKVDVAGHDTLLTFDSTQADTARLVGLGVLGA